MRLSRKKELKREDKIKGMKIGKPDQEWSHEEGSSSEPMTTTRGMKNRKREREREKGMDEGRKDEKRSKK